MSDLISKSALLASTDKEEIHKYEIALFPTIDAVPVVRCKDCKWWGLSEYNTFGIHICKKFSGVRGESDYCSRAERSEASLCDNCDWKNEKGCSLCKRMERSEE